MAILAPTFWPLFLALVGLPAHGGDLAAVDSAPVVLSPVVTSAKAVGSFGFSVLAQKDGLTQKVIQLTVQQVARNSEAERKGLGPLTKILSIDGRDVREFSASFAKGGDLNLKLMDRKEGDRVTLGVLVLGAREPKTITLTEGLRFITADPHASDADDVTPGATHLKMSRD
jgi:C-terminal processing protease CtpA/Prc